MNTFIGNLRLEGEAYDKMREGLVSMLAAGIITSKDYKVLEAEIDLRADDARAPSRRLDVCLACIVMPGFHTDFGLASSAYKRRSIPVLRGLWGYEVNPTGPMISKHAAVGPPIH